MSSGLNELIIDLGIQGTITLTAVPTTTVKLERPGTARLDRMPITIPLAGACQNITGEVACTIDVDIQHQEPKPDVRPRPDEDKRTGTLHVDGSRFEVKLASPGARGSSNALTLDLFADGLVGKGTVAIQLHAAIPHCNGNQPQAPVVLEFDNVATIRCEPSAAAPRIGTMFAFTPLTTGAFAALPLWVTIEETDDPAGGREWKSAKGLRKELKWDSGDRKPQFWRLGCEVLEPGDGGASPLVAFVYPEPSEVPPYEFAFRVSTEKPDGSRFLLPYPPTVFKEVPKPRLRKFSIAIGPPSRESGAPAGAPRESAVQAHLEFEGFAPDIRFRVQVELWRAIQTATTTSFERAEPFASPLIYDTRRESLEAEVGRVADAQGLFAVLSFPREPALESGRFEGAPVPIEAVIDCEEFAHFEVDPTMETGAFWAPHAASRVCSEEAKTVRPKTTLLDLERVKTVMWKQHPEVKPSLEAVLEGNVTPGTRSSGGVFQCPPGVARSIQSALVALKFFVVKDGDATTNDAYGFRMNKAFGKFLYEYREGVFRDLLVDEHGDVVRAADVIAVFTKPPGAVKDPQLLPIIPVRKQAFEALLSAVAESRD